MAIDYVTARTGLFYRLGHVLGWINTLNTHRGTTIVTNANNIQADFGSGQYPQLVGPWQAAFDAYQKSSPAAALAALQNFAQQLLINQVNDQASKPLPSLDLQSALIQLNADMAAGVDNQTVLQTAVSLGALTAVAGNRNSYQLNFSVKRGDGLQNDNIYAETLRVQCLADSSDGITVAGREPWSISGKNAAIPDMLSWTWPAGSGIGTPLGSASLLSSIDAGQYGTQTTIYGNLLNNGDFELFPSATVMPTGWAATIGTINGTILRSTASYKGTYALQFVGNGAELTTIAQTFNTGTPATATGTSGIPLNQWPHSLCLWAKADAASTGILRFAIVDGNDAVINDDQGAALSATLDVSTLTTSYTPQKQLTFNLPLNFPATMKLQLKFTTALANAKNVWIDHLSFSRMNEAYAGGVFGAMHSSAIPAAKNDAFTQVVNNTGGGKFIQGFQRLFDLAGKRMLLRTSGVPTINDNLIV